MFARPLPSPSSPGHASSLCHAFRDLCCTPANCGWGPNSPLTPVPDAQGRIVSLDVIEAILDELAAISPDEIFHLGGDEAHQGCWQNDSAVQAWMQTQGMGNNTNLVYKYFVSAHKRCVASSHSFLIQPPARFYHRSSRLTRWHSLVLKRLFAGKKSGPISERFLTRARSFKVGTYVLTPLATLLRKHFSLLRLTVAWLSPATIINVTSHGYRGSFPWTTRITSTRSTRRGRSSTTRTSLQEFQTRRKRHWCSGARRPCGAKRWCVSLRALYVLANRSAQQTFVVLRLGWERSAADNLPAGSCCSRAPVELRRSHGEAGT